MGAVLDTVTIYIGGYGTLLFGLYNWWKFVKEADRDYVEQQMNSKYRYIIQGDYEEVRKFTETYRIAMRNIFRKILFSILILSCAGAFCTFILKSNGSIWRVMYFIQGCLFMMIIVTAAYFVTNPFDILIIKCSPRYLFRRCCWQKLATFQICHSLNLIFTYHFESLTAWSNAKSIDNPEPKWDLWLKDEMVYSTGILFVFMIWRYAVSYYCLAFHSVAQTKQRFERRINHNENEFGAEVTPIKSSIQLSELISSVLKLYNDTLSSCALVAFACNLYHWEFNSYATYYLDKGYYNLLAIYACVLISVTLGYYFFAYFTRKHLMVEDEQSKIWKLRPAVIAYMVSSFVIFSGLMIMILWYNSPELIKVYDPYDQAQSIGDLGNWTYVLIHYQPMGFLIVLMINSSIFSEHDNHFSINFRSVSEVTFMGTLLKGKTYSLMGCFIPYIVLIPSLVYAWYIGRAYGMITYGVCFVVITQLSFFVNDFESYHNMYGAIIAYANPDQLIDRNSQYANVLKSVEGLGKFTKGLPAVAFSMACQIAFIKIAYVFEQQIINVFQFEFFGAIFFGCIIIQCMKFLELFSINYVTTSYQEFVSKHNFWYDFRMEKFIERLIAYYYCGIIPLMTVIFMVFYLLVNYIQLNSLMVGFFSIFAYSLMNSYQEKLENNYYIQDNDIIENKYQFQNLSYKTMINNHPGRLGVTECLVNEFVHLQGPLSALLFCLSITIDLIEYPPNISGTQGTTL